MGKYFTTILFNWCLKDGTARQSDRKIAVGDRSHDGMIAAPIGYGSLYQCTLHWRTCSASDCPRECDPEILREIGRKNRDEKGEKAG